MKKRVLCICLALLMVGCSAPLEGSDKSQPPAVSVPQEESRATSSEPEAEPSDQSGPPAVSVPQEESRTDSAEPEPEALIHRIYRLTREEFQSFVKDIDSGAFPTEAVSYAPDDEALEEPVRLRWEQFYREFTCTKAGFESLLSEKGVRQELKEATLFMTYEELPMAWMQTEDRSFFLWGTFATGELTFVFSRDSDFSAFFAEKECKVLVNGEDIDSAVPGILHGFSADVPMLAVLQKLGATVAWDTSEKASVCFGGETYGLDLELVTFGAEEDLLGECLVAGGYSVYYPVEGDVMISHTAMLTLLEELGIGCSVSVENEKAVIEYLSE